MKNLILLLTLISYGITACNNADKVSVQEERIRPYVRISDYTTSDAKGDSNRYNIILNCTSNLPLGTVIIASVQKNVDRSNEVIPSVTDIITLADSIFKVTFPDSLLMAGCIFYIQKNMQTAEINEKLNTEYRSVQIKTECPGCIYYSAYSLSDAPDTLNQLPVPSHPPKLTISNVYESGVK
jgi:hypothetical protein